MTKHSVRPNEISFGDLSYRWLAVFKFRLHCNNSNYRQVVKTINWYHPKRLCSIYQCYTSSCSLHMVHCYFATLFSDIKNKICFSDNQKLRRGCPCVGRPENKVPTNLSCKEDLKNIYILYIYRSNKFTSLLTPCILSK